MPKILVLFPITVVIINNYGNTVINFNHGYQFLKYEKKSIFTSRIFERGHSLEGSLEQTT